MLLHGRDQGLDDEDVPFPAVGLKLDLQAVVGEPLQPDGLQRDGQVLTDLGGETGVSAPAEHGDLSHCRSLGRAAVGLVSSSFRADLLRAVAAWAAPPWAQLPRSCLAHARHLPAAEADQA